MHLQSLAHLNLSNNFLPELYPVLFELTNLKYLNADNNPISCIPNEIIKLTKLEELTLTHTELDALPDNQETRKFILQLPCLLIDSFIESNSSTKSPLSQLSRSSKVRTRDY